MEETLGAMKQDLLKMLCTKELALDAHYMYNAISLLESRIQTDVNANMRAERAVK